MWQKEKRRWHLFAVDVARMTDGQYAATVCSGPIQVRRKYQSIFPTEHRCKFCSRVSQLIHTSISEARSFLQKETNLTVIRRALELTQSTTLTKMLEARIRRLESHSQEGK